MNKISAVSLYAVLSVAIGFMVGHLTAPQPAVAGMSASMQMQPRTPDERALSQAMATMDEGMTGMHFTGNPDRDFMVMMIPHHQGAIDMAKAELAYGTNPRVRALASGIITAQQREIHEMRTWLFQR